MRQLAAIFHAPRKVLEAYIRALRKDAEWSRAPGKCDLCGADVPEGEDQCDGCLRAWPW